MVIVQVQPQYQGMSIVDDQVVTMVVTNLIKTETCWIHPKTQRDTSAVEIIVVDLS